MPSPLILDVDTGIDDCLALLYAAATAEAELLAVTCCGGNTTVEQVARNTMAVLETVGRGEVEVGVGRPGPIARPLRTTPETHGPTGLGYVDARPGGTVSDRDGVRVIIEEARLRPGEVTLVTLGPWTNLAAAVLSEPELPLLLREVVAMGGVFGHAGNTTPRVEWNVHVDPEAAKVVLQQWEHAVARGARPVTMLGLDVTEGSRMLPEDLVEVARRSGLPVPDGTARDLMHHRWQHPVLDLVRDSLRFYFEFHAEHDGFYGAHVHDPFVVGAALDRGLLTTRPATVDIELGGRWTEGETVADWRHHWGRGVNAEVAVAGDGKGFRDRLIGCLVEICRGAGR